MGDLVVACIAPQDQRPEVDPLSGEVAVNDAMSSLSPADASAVEHALRAGELWDVPVVVVAAGGEAVEPALREAVALGARAVRVPIAHTHQSPGASSPCEGADLAGDPASVAAALAETIRFLGDPLLVVCGDRSSLSGVGAVPAMLAHHLSAAQALGLVSLSPNEDRTVVAERRLDAGWRERVRLTPPAVCSVEAAGVRLRRAALDRALEAASAAIQVATVGRAGAGAPPDSHAAGDQHVAFGRPRFYRPRTKAVPPPAGGTHDRIVALTGALANREPPRVEGPLEPDQAADRLLDFLRRAGVEIPGPR